MQRLIICFLQHQKLPEKQSRLIIKKYFNIAVIKTRRKLVHTFFSYWHTQFGLERHRFKVRAGQTRKEACRTPASHLTDGCSPLRRLLKADGFGVRARILSLFIPVSFSILSQLKKGTWSHVKVVQRKEVVSEVIFKNF